MANSKSQPKRVARKRKAAAARKTPVRNYDLAAYLRRLAFERETKHKARGQELAAKYSINNPDAMWKLLQTIDDLQLENAATLIVDGGWRIPKGFKTWLEVHSTMKEAALAIWSANRILRSDDDAVWAALIYSHERANVDLDLVTLMKASAELEIVLKGAASIFGKKGNRPLAPWKHEAARLSQCFWFDQIGKTPRRYFSAVSKPVRGEKHSNLVTAPGNDFSKWFCEVMRLFGIGPSECDTLLRKSKWSGRS